MMDSDERAFRTAHASPQMWFYSIIRRHDVSISDDSVSIYGPEFRQLSYRFG